MYMYYRIIYYLILMTIYRNTLGMNNVIISPFLFQIRATFIFHQIAIYLQEQKYIKEIALMKMNIAAPQRITHLIVTRYQFMQPMVVPQTLTVQKKLNPLIKRLVVNRSILVKVQQRVLIRKFIREKQMQHSVLLFIVIFSNYICKMQPKKTCIFLLCSYF